jgi:hypothetical protein
LHKNFAAVIPARVSFDQILSRKAINQFDRSMMHDLKLLRQLADG